VKKLVADGFSEIVLCGTRLGIYHCETSGATLAGLTGVLLAPSSQLDPYSLTLVVLETLAAHRGQAAGRRPRREN